MTRTITSTLFLTIILMATARAATMKERLEYRCAQLGTTRDQYEMRDVGGTVTVSSIAGASGITAAELEALNDSTVDAWCEAQRIAKATPTRFPDGIDANLLVLDTATGKGVGYVATDEGDLVPVVFAHESPYDMKALKLKIDAARIAYKAAKDAAKAEMDALKANVEKLKTDVEKLKKP